MVLKFDANLMQDGIFGAKYSNISCDQADSIQETFANIIIFILINIYIYISNLVVMVNQERK